jgi:hypothetical protein
MEQVKQSRPDSGRGYLVKILETFEVIFSLLGSRLVDEWLEDIGSTSADGLIVGCF